MTAEPKVYQYVVFAPMTHGVTAHVHKLGCSDCAKKEYRNQERTSVDANDPIQAAFAILNADDLGYTAEDVKVFPCCKDAAAVDLYPERKE